MAKNNCANCLFKTKWIGGPEHIWCEVSKKLMSPKSFCTYWEDKKEGNLLEKLDAIKAIRRCV